MDFRSGLQTPRGVAQSSFLAPASSCVGSGGFASATLLGCRNVQIQLGPAGGRRSPLLALFLSFALSRVIFPFTSFVPRDVLLWGEVPAENLSRSAFLRRSRTLQHAGGGYLVVYEIGVVQSLLERAPEVVRSASKVYGASAGSLIAASVVCQCCLDDLKIKFYTIAQDVRKNILGPLSHGYSIIQTIQKHLYQSMPENSHQMATGRLFISLTRAVDGQNVIVSEYSSKEELIQALICSCFVPIYFGFIPPSFRGVRYVDGGFSNLQPYSDLETVITVSPFTGEIDICPRDCPAIFYSVNINSSIHISMENLGRLWHAFFPPSCQDLQNICSQGHQDAILFLHRNNIFGLNLAKTLQSEVVSRFHTQDFLQAHEEASSQVSQMGALKTAKETISKQSNSVIGKLSRTDKRQLEQLPLHFPKALAVLHMKKRPGLLSFTTEFLSKHLRSFGKSIEQLWHFWRKSAEERPSREGLSNIQDKEKLQAGIYEKENPVPISYSSPSKNTF